MAGTADDYASPLGDQVTAVRVRVEGFVQGVFFRVSTRTVAKHLGLRGWVRNNRDGSVEVFFQGSREAIEHAVAWCHQGPDGARVDRVTVRPADPDPGWPDFTVLK